MLLYILINQIHVGVDVIPWNFGSPTCVCQHCGAIMWYEECTIKWRKVSSLKFSLCCSEGKALFPLLREAPDSLKSLLDSSNKPMAVQFHRNIQRYNSIFAFTSMGGYMDNKINDTSEPYVFHLNGQNYHWIGFFLLSPGQSPSFAQLYVHDTDNEIDNRIECTSRGSFMGDIDPAIVAQLQLILDKNNTLVKAFSNGKRWIQIPANTRYMHTPSEQSC